MTPVQHTTGEDRGVQNAIDPISRQILQRTQTQHKIPQTFHHATPSHTMVGQTEDLPERQSAESDSIRRSDTGLSTKASKDKKKGVSFLSRIMGGKKREDNFDVRDTVSEISENRSGGVDAEVFSQPVGFIPTFPAPPKYIRVKSQNRRRRDFDRLFLAQILAGCEPKSRKASSEVDSKIIGINDVPTVAPPNSSSKNHNNAVWAAEFSKDGRYFAAAGQDKKLRVWEVVTKEYKEEEEQPDANSEVEQNVKLNAPVFKQKLVREYDGHTAAVLDLSWSKNNFLLSSSMDKTVRLYHVSRAECLCAFKHNDFVTSIQFHPRDDRFFLAGSLDSKLRLWSIPDKSVAYWAQVSDMVTAVAFTPDGKTAIAGTLSGTCILYSTEGLKAHSQIHVRSTRGRNTKGSKITGIDTISIPREHSQPDVKLLITSNDSRVRMYNLKDRTLELKFKGNENSVSQIRATFSDDGKFVICGSEDRKVYIWPTGPVEKQDSDRRPVEIFEAHSAIVTTAVLAPASTRRLLAQSCDPIYDLCNPPPVVLLSRTDSARSSPANTNHSGQSDEQQQNGNQTSDSPSQPVESPAYKARHTHVSGHVIVSADYNGQIKVFRQDCAYQKRRDMTWDAGSSFSKRMLSRNGSITPRTSIASSNNRNSLTFSKNPSADRINSWRNSITNLQSQSAAASVSDYSVGQTESRRERGTSPKRSISKRLAHRPHNILIASNPPATKQSQPEKTPDITVQSPLSPDESSAYEASNIENRGTSPPPQSKPHSDPTLPRRTATGELSLSGESLPMKAANPFAAADENHNPLSQIGDQSYIAWNANAFTSMLQQEPRTPAFPPGLSRPISMVSRLSSELSSSSSIKDPSDQQNLLQQAQRSARQHGLRAAPAERLHITRPGLHNTSARKSSGDLPNMDVSMNDAGVATISRSSTMRGTEDEEEELKCQNCGSEKFRMIKVDGGGRSLRCRGCGTAV